MRQDRPHRHNTAAEHPVQIDTLGLIQGFIDLYLQVSFYPRYANNNTYNFKAATDEEYAYALSNVSEAQNAILECRKLANQLDPQFTANNELVNKACEDALENAFINVSGFGVLGNMAVRFLLFG